MPKEKGLATGKLTSSKQTAKAARILNSKIKKLESHEAKLLLAFAKTQDPADLTEPAVNLVWQFFIWLRKNDYLIVEAKRLVSLSLKFG